MTTLTISIPAQTALELLTRNSPAVANEVLSEDVIRIYLADGRFIDSSIQPIDAETFRLISQVSYLPSGAVYAEIEDANAIISVSAGLGSTLFENRNVIFSDADDIYDVAGYLEAAGDAVPDDLSPPMFNFSGGFDRVVFDVETEDVAISLRDYGEVSFLILGATDVPTYVQNAEAFEFEDATILVQEDGTLSGGGFGEGLNRDAAMRVAYLYEAGLDRDGNIDAEGLNFWIDARENAFSERQTAQFFLDSPEFEAAFGAPDSLTDLELVQRLYLNVLNRAGEQGGVDFWVDALSGGVARDQLLLFFASSPENIEGSPFVEDLAEVEPGEWAFLS